MRNKLKKPSLITVFICLFFISISSYAIISMVSIKDSVNKPDTIDKVDNNIIKNSLVPFLKSDELKTDMKDTFSLTNNQKYYEELVNKENLNILVVGMDPTYGNFDGIYVLSISKEDKNIHCINLPRDMYIDYSENVINQIKKFTPEFLNERGNFKLNAAPVIGRRIEYKNKESTFTNYSAMIFLCDVLNEIFNIKINDYVVISTSGFRDIIDYFGGVEINVPIFMNYYDPDQDLYIHLEPGLQTLNGYQAEGFVRFRQGYTRSGVFVQHDINLRTTNTVNFINSFIKQHVTLKNITNADEIMNLINKNIKTSVNSVDQIFTYSLLSRDIVNNNYNFISKNIKIKQTKKIQGSYYEIIKTSK